MGQTQTSNLTQAAQKTLDSFNGMTSGTQTTKKQTKLGPGPRRLLKEEDIDIIKEELCELCFNRV